MTSSSLFFLCLFGLAILNQGRCKPSEDEYPQDVGDVDENNYEDEDSSGPPPKMISKSKTILVDIGGSVNLPCEVDGNPAKFSRVWRKGKTGLFVGNLKQLEDKRLNTLQSGELQIQQITLMDDGNYTCLLSPEEFVTYIVAVKSPAQITEIFPREPFVTLKEHTSLTLKCVAGIGMPKPDVRWFKNEYSLSQGKEDTAVNAATYTIMNASMEDSGIYKCTAHNQLRAEPDVRTIEIQVTYPPIVKIAEGEDIVPTGEGYESELRCIVTGPKKSQVKWFKDDVPIEISSFVKPERKGNNHYLRILNTKKEDFGNYKCVAKNQEGESSAVIELSGKPKPIYKEFKTDKNTNDPVLVFNTTSFAPVEEYELLYKRQEANAWEALRPSPVVTNPEEGTAVYVLEQAISGLEPGVYVAQLKAKNVHGWSEYSSQAEFPKEHEGDLRLTGGLLAASENSSAELRISLAMLMSLLVAHFYC